MPLLTTVGMLMGGASAVKGFLGGGKMRSAGQRALAKIEDVDLQNAYANLKPSLEAERRMFGQSSTRMASVADVAQGLDAASAMSLVGNTQGQLNEFEMQGIQSMIDKDYEGDRLRAGDEVRIQQQQEQRNTQRRAEAISQINAGTQMQQSSLEGAAGLAISAGNAQSAADSQAGFSGAAERRLYNKTKRQEFRAKNPGMGFLGKNTGAGKVLGKAGGFLGGLGSKIIQGIGSLFG